VDLIALNVLILQVVVITLALGTVYFVHVNAMKPLGSGVEFIVPIVQQ